MLAKFIPGVDPALLSGLVLAFALILFISEKVRHDLVAMLALLAALLLGLVAPGDALSGFADPAVIAVAAVLVVGRALENTGFAAWLAQHFVPERAPFAVQLALLMGLGAFLSAFMNNIAALVITMPIAVSVATRAGRPAGATLMPLSFATILGGITTLIGTPANLILSSVRERELGTGFSFFAMTPVGVTVCLVGLAYLALIGWRLIPVRGSGPGGIEPVQKAPWRIVEVVATRRLTRAELNADARKAQARLSAHFGPRGANQRAPGADIEPGDRIQLLSRQRVADLLAALDWVEQPGPDPTIARMVVANGSPLVGSGYQALSRRTEGLLAVVAAGPRAVKARLPFAAMSILPGDQLFVRGEPDDLGRFSPSLRLLEVDRVDPTPVNFGSAALTVAIFVTAIISVVAGLLSPAIAFLAAAVAVAGLRLIAADSIYSAIDWSVIILLAAMIPVGESFETSGAAARVADWLAIYLAGHSPFVMLAALTLFTLIVTIFLNNVATAVIIGPLAIRLAHEIGISPDAALFAVLVGTSSDFLTPIGHQNNLLVMGPGNYRFTDYIRVGAILSLLVVIVTALFLSRG